MKVTRILYTILNVTKSKFLLTDKGNFNKVLEIIKGLREIKLFAAENNAVNNFTDKNNDLIKSNIKQAKIQFSSDQIINLIYL